MKRLQVCFHAAMRSSRRTGHESRFMVALKSLDNKALKGGLPNGSWYRPVLDVNGVVVGYICGRGLHVATTLDGSMVPKGTKV